MDNQQNQPGPMPGDDIRVQNAGTNMGSTGLGNDATVSGASARKGSGARSGASQASATPDAQSSNQADQPRAESQSAGQQTEGQQTDAPEGTLLDTALNSGKQWIEDSGVLNNVNQLPQSLKDLGNRALDKVNGLTTTQKVVGGAILAAGIGWLATRKGKSEGSASSPYNYGRQRDAGSYGRRSYGYQAPDASTSRRPEAGSGRSDSGAPYGNGGSRYGNSSSYSSDANSPKSTAGNTGIKSGSGRSDSSYGSASASTDHGAQRSSNSFGSKDDSSRSIE
jgi:hypothetical protein